MPTVPPQNPIKPTEEHYIKKRANHWIQYPLATRLPGSLVGKARGFPSPPHEGVGFSADLARLFFNTTVNKLVN